MSALRARLTATLTDTGICAYLSATAAHFTVPTFRVWSAVSMTITHTQMTLPTTPVEKIRLSTAMNGAAKTISSIARDHVTTMELKFRTPSKQRPMVLTMIHTLRNVALPKSAVREKRSGIPTSTQTNVVSMAICWTPPNAAVIPEINAVPVTPKILAKMLTTRTAAFQPKSNAVMAASTRMRLAAKKRVKSTVTTFTCVWTLQSVART